MKISDNVKTKIAQPGVRAKCGMMGAKLSSQYFQAEVRESFLDFEKKKRQIALDGNSELFVNRTPIRCHMKAHDIVNVGLIEIPSPIEGATPTVALCINRGDDGMAEITIPASDSTDPDNVFECTQEAFSAALHGDKTKVFSDPAKLVAQLNTINRNEIAQIRNLRAQLDKWEQGINSAIVENEKKLKEYEEQMTGCLDHLKPSVEEPGKVVINIHQDEA